MSIPYSNKRKCTEICQLPSYFCSVIRHVKHGSSDRKPQPRLARAGHLLYGFNIVVDSSYIRSSFTIINKGRNQKEHL